VPFWTNFGIQLSQLIIDIVCKSIYNSWSEQCGKKLLQFVVVISISDTQKDRNKKMDMNIAIKAFE
jgi:hypothetical protein